MLAIKAPGAASDIAPTWLVSEVTAHSKAEFQRAERVRRGAGKGSPKGKQDKGVGRGLKGVPASHYETRNAVANEDLPAGNPMRLINGMDYMANICGIDEKVSSRPPLRAPGSGPTPPD